MKSMVAMQTAAEVHIAAEPAKVLVIDDNPGFLFGVSRILEKSGFEVLTSHDGFSGIARARQELPNLILLDVNMPRKNGFKVRQELGQAEDTRTIPVIFLTALQDPKSTLTGLHIADDYINKPVDADILEARIRAVLRRFDAGYQKAVLDAKLPFAKRGDYREWGQAVEVHDPGTAGHTNRVTRLFTAFARSLGVHGRQLELARKGAMVHDIGKLAVPGAILDKPGSLDTDEWDLIRKHPVIGVKMLGSVMDEPDILDIVRNHHERWDGTGYPDRLAGEEIPLLARIFSVVDVFAALWSKRPYKAGIAEVAVLEIIKSERGRQFDPEIVDIFIAQYDFLKREGENEDDPSNPGVR